MLKKLSRLTLLSALSASSLSALADANSSKTLAPIDNDLINFDQLTKNEKNYLFKYNMLVYSKLNPYLNSNEKKWLASFI